MGTLRPFQQVADTERIHAVCALALDEQNRIAGPYAGFVRGRAFKGIHDDHTLHAVFPYLRLDVHAHAVVTAVLIFAHLRVRLGIVEVRVRIQHVQHVGDRAVVDHLVNLVGRELVRIVRLHHRVHIGELVQTVSHRGLIGSRLCVDATVDQRTRKRAGAEEK